MYEEVGFGCYFSNSDAFILLSESPWNWCVDETKYATCAWAEFNQGKEPRHFVKSQGSLNFCISVEVLLKTFHLAISIVLLLNPMLEGACGTAQCSFVHLEQRKSTIDLVDGKARACPFKHVSKFCKKNLMSFSAFLKHYFLPFNGRDLHLLRQEHSLWQVPFAFLLWEWSPNWKWCELSLTAARFCVRMKKTVLFQNAAL